MFKTVRKSGCLDQWLSGTAEACFVHYRAKDNFYTEFSFSLVCQSLIQLICTLTIRAKSWGHNLKFSLQWMLLLFENYVLYIDFHNNKANYWKLMYLICVGILILCRYLKLNFFSPPQCLTSHWVNEHESLNLLI